LNDSFELEVGDYLKNPNELDMSITIEVEPHDLDNSKDISHKSCKKEDGPTNMEFDDDVLYVEYEFFFHMSLMSM